ncbi:alpha/beta hydrolase [Actinoplanes sp. TBRC 11911]|uniref:alpha/beta hydrolase n=1 Tax=Actinoplanes sp. TBRC 11911 TaxID=2729386 RepID=UPI00145D92AC|nr:alpha/beta hydrolase [Actinoplanes sp. TBRC 11911]NMO50666.1 alpha/beta hydrolase [Actinoplanes sp. TBRC 11911]
MAFPLDPEWVAARKRMFGADAPPPPVIPVGDVKAVRTGIDTVHAMIDVAQPVPDDVTTTDFEVTSADGATILARWYVKDGSRPGSAVLHFHGGGVIASSVDLYHGRVARYVSDSGVPFLSVGYRLAPEFPHPKPVEDAYAALTWLAAHASELGVDPGRIAVMGDSGGGNLAAAVALWSRDRNGPAIARQILLYPMLDDRTSTPVPGMEDRIGDYNIIVTAWQALLGDAYGTADVSPYAAPARMTDATGMPPLFMEAVEIDPVRDEDIEYARRTQLAGVSTELHVHPAVPHGFEPIAYDSAVARRMMADRLRVIGAL